MTATGQTRNFFYQHPYEGEELGRQIWPYIKKELILQENKNYGKKELSDTGKCENRGRGRRGQGRGPRERHGSVCHICRAGRCGGSEDQEETQELRRGRRVEICGIQQAESGTDVQPLRCLWGLQMAEPALSGPAQGQAATGDGSADPNRKGGTARVPPHLGFGQNQGISQQDRIRLCQQAVVYPRGTRRSPTRCRIGTGCHRIPHHGSIRQNLSHREMLAHGRFAQPDTQLHLSLRGGQWNLLFRHPRAERTPARHHVPQLQHGRVDGAHTVPLR